MKYSIDQYPKNKDFDQNKLSDDQKELRLNVKVYKYGKRTKCKCCEKKLATSEFYIKDRATGRRSTKCRDCVMKSRGVIEVGKQRFAFKIADKGFRRCSVCKKIKPLSEYPKCKRQYLGISNNCKNCGYELHNKFVKHQQDTIGLSYIKEYGRTKGIFTFTKEINETLRQEIIKNREERDRVKYTLDGKKFKTLESFAQYVSFKYNINSYTVIFRINKGYSEKECTIPETEFRSLNSGTNKGQIKVTDCKTNEVFIFRSTKDKELLKMFSGTTITKYLKSGEIVSRKREQKKGQSKYRIDCKIERIKS